LWAEISEKLSDTVDRELKYGGGDPNLLAAVCRLSSGIAELEEEEADRARFIEKLDQRLTVLPKPARKTLRDINKQYLQRREKVINSLRSIKEGMARTP
jgi:hypothetical protein